MVRKISDINRWRKQTKAYSLLTFLLPSKSKPKEKQIIKNRKRINRLYNAHFVRFNCATIFNVMASGNIHTNQIKTKPKLIKKKLTAATYNNQCV